MASRRRTTLAAVSRELHRRGIRLVLDAVFHHTGQPFRDVGEKGQVSEYCDWYYLDFTRRSPYGEPFHYKGWAGNYDLVKLNLKNPAVRDHLFKAVSWWIDGSRLTVCGSTPPMRSTSIFRANSTSTVEQSDLLTTGES